MKLTLLRNLLLLDAALLFLLGALLVFLPKQVELAFHFKDLPEGVGYIIGLWGCVLATMGFGYVIASANPIRHVIWVQVGMARGMAEFILGLVCLVRGTVSFHQAGFGILVAGLISLGYLLLYPRQPRLVPGPEGRDPTPSKSESV